MSHPSPKRARKAPGRPYPPQTVRERGLSSPAQTFIPYPALQRADVSREEKPSLPNPRPRKSRG